MYGIISNIILEKGSRLWNSMAINNFGMIIIIIWVSMQVQYVLPLMSIYAETCFKIVMIFSVVDS